MANKGILCTTFAFSQILENKKVLTEKKVKVFGIEKVAKNTRKALGAIWKMDPRVSTWSLIRVAALAFCHHYIFLPIWWYWGIVGNLVLIYNGIVALYEALLLSKGSDGGGSVDGLQKIVIYRWTTDRLNPFQLTRTCHVYPLKKNRQHTNNYISFLFSKRRANWLQSLMLFFLSFA